MSASDCGFRKSVIFSCLAMASAFNVALAGGVPDSALSAFTWRNIAPAQIGTRINEVAVPELIKDGVNHSGRIIYAGAPGGLYKTTDWGNTWSVVTDALPTAAISAVAVAPTNPRIVWIGTGDYIMGNGREVVGTGVYKSTDGGGHWQQMGLSKGLLVGKVAIDPANPNIVYVAVLGSLWQESKDRGIYRTQDGGRTWKRVAYVDARTGAIDVAIDQKNPLIVYAAMWQYGEKERNTVEYGSGSRILRTTDGGDTWQQLVAGLPTDHELGRIALAVSLYDPARVYAWIDDHGVLDARNVNGRSVRVRGAYVMYVSEDYGTHWRQGGELPDGQESFYGHISVDPQDENRVYITDQTLLVSNDGGKTTDFTELAKEFGGHYLSRFDRFTLHHCQFDAHDLWIDPHDAFHLLCATDQGLVESRDRGMTWRHFKNIPGGLYYTLATDYASPFYHIFGTLQDQGVLGVPELDPRWHGISPMDWVATLGGEAPGVSSTPLHPERIYMAGSGWRAMRFDWPDTETDISSARELLGLDEFDWVPNNCPLPSKFDKHLLYLGVTRLYVSRDDGRSWAALSGNLVRELPKTVYIMGAERRRPIWLNDGIREIAESPLSSQVLWVGTNYGAIHVTRDGGRTWSMVSSPRGTSPRLGVISQIVPSRASSGTAYVAVNNVGSGDYAPYILLTRDFGRHWTSISAGLPRRAAVWSLAEDAPNPNVLFAGTDDGVFVSFDAGWHWTSLRNNMPVIRVTGIVIQPQWDDLVVSTWGRGIYVLDDISPLENLPRLRRWRRAVLFPIRDAFRYGTRDEEWSLAAHHQRDLGNYQSQNPPYGTAITYTIPRGEGPAAGIDIDGTGGRVASVDLKAVPGVHRIWWNLSGSTRITTLYGGATTESIPLPPGEYQARLRVGAEMSAWRPFRILALPGAAKSQADYETEYTSLVRIARLERLTATALSEAQGIQRRGVSGSGKSRLESVLEALEGHRVAGAPSNYPPLPGVVQQLQGMAWVIERSDGAPTRTALTEISKISATVSALQRVLGSIRVEASRAPCCHAGESAAAGEQMVRKVSRR